MSQVQKCGFLWELVGNDGAAAMFRGVNHINMDTKGRLTVPTRYRDEINSLCDGRMVATIDTEERCLLIYPQPAWDDIQRKVEALPSFNLAARRVQRLLIGHATDIPMDRNGRLLVTPAQRICTTQQKRSAPRARQQIGVVGRNVFGLSEESSGLMRSLKLSFQRTEIFIVIRKAGVGAHSCSP